MESMAANGSAQPVAGTCSQCLETQCRRSFPGPPLAPRGEAARGRTRGESARRPTRRGPGPAWRSCARNVRTGELSLADFAADLHDVMMQRGARPIYEDPIRFFARTYPTFSRTRPGRRTASRRTEHEGGAAA